MSSSQSRGLQPFRTHNHASFTEPHRECCNESGTILFYHGDEGLQLKEVDREKLPTKLLIPEEAAALDPYFK